MTTLSHNRKAAPLDHSDDDDGEDDDDDDDDDDEEEEEDVEEEEEESLWYIAHFTPAAVCRFLLSRSVGPCFALFSFFLVRRQHFSKDYLVALLYFTTI